MPPDSRFGRSLAPQDARNAGLALSRGYTEVMLRPSIPDKNDAIEAAWQDVEKLLDEATQLGHTACATDEFHTQLLARAVRALAAWGGAIWLWKDAAHLTLSASHGLMADFLAEPRTREAHAAALRNQLERAARGPVELALASPLDRVVSSGSHTVLAVAAGSDNEYFAVLELFVDRDANPIERQSQMNVLAAFAEILNDFHRQRRITELGGVVAQLENVSEFSLQVQGRVDCRATCYVVANELRRVADCDRVLVLRGRRARLRVEAISGMENFDRRSPVVRAAERLALAVADDERSWWYAEDDRQDEEKTIAWQAYVDVTHVRVAAVVPLRVTATALDADRSPVVGVVVCERFERRPFGPVQRRGLELLCRHAGVAVGHTMDLEKLPLMGLARTLGRVSSLASPVSRVKMLLASLVAVVGLAVAAMWPVEFTIGAQGTLHPAQRRDIFAPSDGVVQEVGVKQGDTVAAGDVLLAMQNDELELEITRIFGELQTARRQLQAVQASRLDTVQSKPATRDARTDWAAEEERLKEVIRSLEVQHEHRQKQRQQLTVRSPISGELLTWDVERLLRWRPLKRGQRLMTVADVGGAWILEMRVADADVGHVLQAAQELNTPLPISYRTAAQPQRQWTASLMEISDWTETNETEGPYVRMTAKLQDASALGIRPGASASAQIHLGRRPRAYVWLRDLIEFARIQAWF